ncbi:MAG: macro domain-containing protein [Desulfotomaculaceae bacterium]|nr:macro domain-containing protein [Desulfotomaculaceae bacterium]
MITVIKGDITELAVDAIVNAANNHLWMGAGVAGAIKRRGGASIEAEAVAMGPIPVGEAVVTGAGALKSAHVIHAAAMGQDLDTDEARVRLATRNALLRARELGLSSIAFPALGTGVGGLGLKITAKVMLSEVRRHLARDTSVENIVFAVFDDTAFETFSEVAKRDQVVCLGDSITYGYPYGPESSWVAFSSKLVGLSLVNEGMNGDSSRGMLERLQYDVLQTTPAYVIILGGANDVLLGSNLEELQYNIKVMAAKAFEAGICPVLGMPPPALLSGGFVPASLAGKLAVAMENIGCWIRAFAEQEQLPVLDFYTPMLDPQTGKANLHYYTDGAHPNQKGYRELARAATQVLLRLKKGINCD